MKEKAYCQIEAISFIKMFLVTLQSPFGVQRRLYINEREARVVRIDGMDGVDGV